MLRSIAKIVLPSVVRSQLLLWHRDVVLRRAIRTLRRNPERSLRPESDVIPHLIYGWGNEGWSASAEFLGACLREALKCKGPILECGSGVTTLAIGVIAEHVGTSVCALEHIEQWGRRVQDIATKLGIRNITVCRSPLKNYGEFAWYSTPPEPLGQRYSLVLCDGPPADTPGGRYGLLTIALSSLENGCVILLDDAIRDDEQLTAQRWQSEVPMSCEKLGVETPYFRMVLD